MTIYFGSIWGSLYFSRNIFSACGPTEFLVSVSEFINDQTLNQRQIDFVHKIITHIEINGYMESPKVLMKPPFDKPIPFMKLFDQKTRTALVTTINQVYNNAAQEPAMWQTHKHRLTVMRRGGVFRYPRMPGWWTFFEFVTIARGRIACVARCAKITS